MTVLPFADHDTARLQAMFGERLAGLHVYGREVLPFGAARTQPWHDARRRTVGASEIAGVLGIPSSPVSAFTLHWQKRLGWLLDPAEHMEIGLRLEDVIGQLFADRRRDVFVARPRGALYAHESFGHVACSPDFLGVCDVAGALWIVPVECKSDEGGEWGAPGSDEVPAHHRAQALWQATVFAAPFAFVAHMAHKRFRWYVVPNDEGERQEVNGWIVAARDFLHSVGTGVAPDPDDSESTEDTLKALYPEVEDAACIVTDELAGEYLDASELRRYALKRYRHAVNRMRLAMGRSSTATSSTFGQVARRERFPRRAYSVRESTVDRIMPIRRDDGSTGTAAD